MTTPTSTLRTAAYNAKVELAALEKALQGLPFLAGATPSAADAVAFPEVRLVQRANDTKPEIMEAIGLLDMYAQFPRLEAWAARIQALPGYEHSQPPHWKDTAQ